MKPVPQRQFYDGENRGDCQRCCLASIFELDYEDVEVGAYFAEGQAWVKERYPGVELHSRWVGERPLREKIGEYVNWPTSHYEPGFWMATVWSPRIPEERVFGCGCTERVPGGDPECQWCEGKPEEREHPPRFGLHCVVMQNGKLAFDPHPEADPGAPLYFYSAQTLIVTDPAKVLLRP